MHEFIKIVILGIVQGITEFLPISSNAHLIMLERILDYHKHNEILMRSVEKYKTYAIWNS
jgi:undecaprenyl-diphosphatase